MSKIIPRRSPSPLSRSPETQSSDPLLPSLEISDAVRASRGSSQGPLSPPAEIQRPRSALHSGNFTQDISRTRDQPPGRNDNDGRSISREGVLGTSPTTPWYTSPLDWQRSDVGLGANDNERYPDWMSRRSVRSRAPSLQSYSSSYVLQPPTTPLVQQSNSEDLDLSNIPPVDISNVSDRSSRRNTLPPNVLTLVSNVLPDTSQPYNQPSIARRVASMPYQAHRPRRSLTTTLSLRTITSPQPLRTPCFRRSSHSSDSVTPQHASMVGSYEESILRGRMSTAPSKPLDFTAQIGVLGKNGCKPKCPAHVTIPFPAVFYSYGTGAGRTQDSVGEPSPYVGQVDLNHLTPPTEIESSRHKRRRSPAIPHAEEGHISSGPENENEVGSLQTRKRKKRRRTPSPSKLPPAGSYRIPEQGQLQIIIKNPNKTAVKLFLVPYDLTGMEAGTKTFIRQKCYSAGQSIDYALTSQGEGSRSVQIGMNASKKPTLRYLIHVNICSPAKGRFYLYQHIRVVFANRVPDNKEQLQNEIQLPQPRFSAFKPHIEATTPGSSISAKPAAEKAYRRRSSGFGYEAQARDPRSTQSLGGASDSPYMSMSPPPPVPAIPFGLAMSQVRPHNSDHHGFDGAFDDNDTRHITATSDMQSPLSDRTSHYDRNFSGSFKSNSSNSSGGYAKLARGDNGYGGLFGRPSTPEPGEGLLARRLKGLGLARGQGVEDNDV